MIALGFIASFLAGSVATLGALGLMAAWEERRARREISRAIQSGRSGAQQFIETGNIDGWLEEIRRDGNAR